MEEETKTINKVYDLGEYLQDRKYSGVLISGLEIEVYKDDPKKWQSLLDIKLKNHLVCDCGVLVLSKEELELILSKLTNRSVGSQELKLHTKISEHLGDAHG